MLQISVQTVSLQTQAVAETTLLACKAAGATHLGVNLLAGGALYNSAYWPHSSYLTASFDPWAYTIKRAHELGMKAYEWFCPGATYGTFTQFDMAGKHGTPTTTHWLDFSDPAARQRMLDMETDMLTKYPTCDGISLDYIRYPNSSVPSVWNPQGYYKPADVTALVESISNLVKRKGEVYAHTFYPPFCLTDVYQDMVGWLKNGLLDFALPMLQAWPNWTGYKTWPAGHLVRYWCDTYLVPVGMPDKIWPYLYAPDFKNDPTGKTLKSVADMRIQIDDAHAAGFKNTGFYDGRYIANYVSLLKEENTMPVVTNLTDIANQVSSNVTLLKVQRDDLVAQAAALTALAAKLTNDAQSVSTEVDALDAQVARIRTEVANLDSAKQMSGQLTELLQ